MLNKMKITSVTAILTMFLLAGLAISCDSGSTATLSMQSTKPGEAAAASPSPKIAISRSAVSPSLSLPVVDKNGNAVGSIALTKAFLAVKEIEIEMVGQDDEESEYKGTFLVDLLNNTVTPDFPIISLPDGQYDEIEMEIDKLDGTEKDEAGNPLVYPGDDMFGRSLYLEGTYSYNGTERTFKLAYTTEEEIKLKDADSVNSFVMTGHTDLVVAFRMDKWFDFSNVETSLGYDFSDIIDSPINLLADLASITGIESKVMEVIQENIEESADFGIDYDDDGILEEDEDDD